MVLCQGETGLSDGLGGTFDVWYYCRVAYIKSAFDDSGIGWVTLCEGEVDNVRLRVAMNEGGWGSHSGLRSWKW